MIGTNFDNAIDFLAAMSLKLRPESHTSLHILSASVHSH